MKQTVSMSEGTGSYDVLLHDGGGGAQTVLFAAGRGGDPERHHGLLDALAAHGCTVIAPHFEMMEPVPTRQDLVSRMQRVELSLKAFADRGAPTVGIGHSIGATTLLLLSGVEGWTRAREHTLFSPAIDFDRLLLLAPALDFFPHPNALSQVRAPVCCWVGGEDRIAPVAKVMLLKDNARPQQQVEVFIDERAGHFTFMDDPPPGVAECHPDRAAFLTDLARHICKVTTAHPHQVADAFAGESFSDR